MQTTCCDKLLEHHGIHVEGDNDIALHFRHLGHDITSPLPFAGCQDAGVRELI